MAAFSGKVSVGPKLATATREFGQCVAMNNDGVLLTVYTKSQNVAEVAYSADGGATWTPCTTTISNADEDYGLIVDEFDNFFLACDSSALDPRIIAFTFNGTNITVHDDDVISDEAFDDVLIGVAVDNPTATGNKTHIMFVCAGSEAFEVDYDRDTQTFGSISTRSVAQDGLALISSTAHSSEAANPSSPSILTSRYGSSTQTIIERFPWDGTNHRFSQTSDATITETHLANSQDPFVVYDPSLGEGIFARVRRILSGGVVYGTFTPGDTTLEDKSFTPTPTLAPSGGLATDGNGKIRIFYIHEDSLADQDLYGAEYDAGADTFTETVETTTSVEIDVQATGASGGWNAKGRFIAYRWQADTPHENAEMIYIESDISAVGFRGWGIPIKGS